MRFASASTRALRPDSMLSQCACFFALRWNHSSCFCCSARYWALCSLSSPLCMGWLAMSWFPGRDMAKRCPAARWKR